MNTIPDVLVMGNATRDSAYFVDRLPVNDEVAAVNRRVVGLGGRGVVPALVLSALGLRTGLCTVIGLDVREEFESFLHEHGIGTDCLKWDSQGTATTEYVAFVGEGGKGTLAVARPPQLDWTPTDAQREIVRRARVLYVSTNDPNFNAELLSEVVPGGSTVIHNLGVRYETHSTYVELMLAVSTILVGNHLEAAKLGKALGRTANQVFALSPTLQTFIITRGRDGAEVYCRGDERPLSLQAKAVDAVSPVGAGDTFAAGLVATLARGGHLDDGLEFGMTLASLAMRSEASYPDLGQVSALARMG